MTLPGLVLAYGAGALASQVLVLREVLVLCQGQELKLALGLWGWLLWTGLGSLAGGLLAGRLTSGPAWLGRLLALLGVLLPATVLAARFLPSLLPLGSWQSLTPGLALPTFLALLAPFGLASGCFFPLASLAWQSASPGGAMGRVYAWEALGGALGVGLLQVVLLGRLPTLALSLGTGLVLLLGAICLTPPRSLAGRLGAWAGLFVLAAALALSPRLELLSRQPQWPGRQVMAAVDSPYALLTVTREAEQLSFFANSVWHFTYPDPFSAEHAVQLPLLQHPRPERVLLLGGGAASLVPEILKTKSIVQLTYVELDPELVRLAARLIPHGAADPAREPRLSLIHQDARRFLALARERFDVIILGLPEPKNAQLNRFYSREFFRLVRDRLTEQGVFAFALTGGAAGLTPLRAAYLGLLHHTLSQAFPGVLALPGERVWLLGAAAPGALVADPRELAARLAVRGLDLNFVRDYYLEADLSPARQQYLALLLSRQPREVNSDLNIRSYFYDLALTGAKEGIPLTGLLVALKNAPAWLPWAGLGLFGLALAALARRRPAARYLAQVLLLGLGTMALEIIALLLFQVHLGLLYRRLGLLIAAFMLGMALGGLWGARLAAPAATRRRWLLGLQLGLAGLSGLLAVVLYFSGDFPAVAWEGPVQGGYFLLLFIAGGAGGAVFSMSAALWRPAGTDPAWGAGVFYAADLLGATLGALGFSLFVIPVWGIPPALTAVAALHTLAALLLAGRN